MKVISDSQYLDQKSKGTLFIQNEHHALNEGCLYSITGVSDIMAVDDEFNLTCEIPDTDILFYFSWEAYGKFGYYINGYEDVIPDVLGLPESPINSNRNSLNPSVATFRVGDTFTNLGTKIHSTYVSSGTRAGGGALVRNLILKPNTKYLFQLKSADATNIISGSIYWFEFISEE
jgi:hypothetical protein